MGLNGDLLWGFSTIEAIKAAALVKIFKDPGWASSSADTLSLPCLDNLKLVVAEQV